MSTVQVPAGMSPGMNAVEAAEVETKNAERSSP